MLRRPPLTKVPDPVTGDPPGFVLQEGWPFGPDGHEQLVAMGDKMGKSERPSVH